MKSLNIDSIVINVLITAEWEDCNSLQLEWGREITLDFTPKIVLGFTPDLSEEKKITLKITPKN